VQLRRRGISAISVRELEKLGEDDPVLLDYAIENGLVVCSHDSHFLDLAKKNLEHWGIVFIPHRRREIGTVVRALTAVARRNDANDLFGMVLYL